MEEKEKILDRIMNLPNVSDLAKTLWLSNLEKVSVEAVQKLWEDCSRSRLSRNGAYHCTTNTP